MLTRTQLTQIQEKTNSLIARYNKIQDWNHSDFLLYGDTDRLLKEIREVIPKHSTLIQPLRDVEEEIKAIQDLSRNATVSIKRKKEIFEASVDLIKNIFRLANKTLTEFLKKLPPESTPIPASTHTSSSSTSINTNYFSVPTYTGYAPASAYTSYLPAPTTYAAYIPSSTYTGYTPAPITYTAHTPSPTYIGYTPALTYTAYIPSSTYTGYISAPTYTAPAPYSIASSSSSTVSASEKPYVLYGVHMLDGIGDGGHCIDFVNNHEEIATSKYRPLMLMVCPIKSKKTLEAKLRSSGIPFPAENVHVFYHEGDYLNPEAFKAYLNSNHTLQTQLRSVKGMLNISTENMDLNVSSKSHSSGSVFKNFLKDKDIVFPCMTIAEHGKFCRGISLGVGRKDTIGFKLKKTSKVPLHRIEDKEFLSVLCNTSSTVNEELGRQFLKNSLLAPCFFQEAPNQFEQIINAVASSRIAKEYKEAVFVVNKGQTYADIHEYAKFLSKDISSITILTRDEKGYAKREIRNFDCNPNALPIRIIEGHWLEDSDRKILRQNARMEGCSGDKSFEEALEEAIPDAKEESPPDAKFTERGAAASSAGLFVHRKIIRDIEALSKGHLAIYQTRSKSVKKTFVEEMINFIHEEHPDKLLVAKYLMALTSLGTPGAAQRLADCLTPELEEEWSRLTLNLYNRHNAYKNVQKYVKHFLETGTKLELGSDGVRRVRGII